MNIEQTIPRFRVDKTKNPAEVILQCSKCEEDIRSLDKEESINITRAHYCENCYDGTIVLNRSRTHKN